MKVHELVSDERWARLALLLPPHPPQPKGGNPWRPDRPALCGILYVFKTGIGWNDLPLELGCGRGSTCWRRLQAWQAAGARHALYRLLLGEPGQADQIDWSRTSADSATCVGRLAYPFELSVTLPRWHRQGVRLVWCRRSRPRPAP